MRTNEQLKALEEHTNKMIDTLITEFSIESIKVGGVPSRSIKGHYITAQIDALLKNRVVLFK